MKVKKGVSPHKISSSTKPDTGNNKEDYNTETSEGKPSGINIVEDTLEKGNQEIKETINNVNVTLKKREVVSKKTKEINKPNTKSSRITKDLNTIKCEDGLLKTTIHTKFIISENYNIYAFYTPQKKEFTINFFEYNLYTKLTDKEIIKLKFVSNDLILIVYETEIELMSVFNQKIELCIKEKNIKNAFYLKREEIIILEKEDYIIHIFKEQTSEYPKNQIKIINSLIYLNYQNILKEYDLFMNELQRFSCYRINDFWMFEGFLFTLSSNQLILANIEPILDVKASNLFVNEKYIFTYLIKQSETYELHIFEKTEFIPKLLKSILCSSFKVLNQSNIVYLFENKLCFDKLN